MPFVFIFRCEKIKIEIKEMRFVFTFKITRFLIIQSATDMISIENFLSAEIW